jgi:putative aldouronate transport system permease protein
MKVNASRKVFNVINIILMITVILIMTVPLIMVFSTSISSDSVIVKEGFVLFPKQITFSNYIRIFNSGYMNGFKNSVLVTVCATALSMLLTLMLGYGLAQKDLIGRSFLIKFVIVTMVLDVGIIPNYLVVRSLGLINTYSSLVIPMAISTYNLILVKNFMHSIPESLIESARLDGCSELGILFRIVIPVSIPIIAAVTLFYTVAHWNKYFEVVMYINDTNKYTLQVLLRQLIFQSESNVSAQAAYNNFKMAVMILTMLPVILLYPFIQKYFISGIMLGSVKE